MSSVCHSMRYSTIGYYWKGQAQMTRKFVSKEQVKKSFNKGANFYLKAADELPDDDPHYIGKSFTISFY